MWIILSIGLLPLGVIAIVASIDNARASRDNAQQEAQTLLAQHTQRYTLALSRNAFTIRAGRDAIVEAGDAGGICRRTLERLGRRAQHPRPLRDFRQRARRRAARAPASPCPPSRRPRACPAAPRSCRAATFSKSSIYDPSGRIEGIAEYDRATLAAAVNTPALPGDFALELVQGDRVMPLRAMSAAAAQGPQVSADNPFANGQYSLRVRIAAPPISLTEILVVADADPDVALGLAGRLDHRPAAAAAPARPHPEDHLRLQARRPRRRSAGGDAAPPPRSARSARPSARSPGRSPATKPSWRRRWSARPSWSARSTTG